MKHLHLNPDPDPDTGSGFRLGRNMVSVAETVATPAVETLTVAT